MTSLNNAVVVVTGGTRGIGRALVLEALARGAVKVYATARSPVAADDPRIVPMVVDVNDEGSVGALADAAPDATVVINNAGVPWGGGVITSSIETTRGIIETNLIGPIRVAKAFAPVLAANGGGAIVNISSAASWTSGTGAYGASKAGLWNVSHTMSGELAGQGTHVLCAHFGMTDTDMTKGFNVPKNTTEFVASAILDGLEAGKTEVLVDDLARQAKAGLSSPAGGARE